MVIKEVGGVARTLTGGRQKWLKTHPRGKGRRGGGEGGRGRGEQRKKRRVEEEGEGGGREGKGRRKRTIQHKQKFTSNFRRGCVWLCVCERVTDLYCLRMVAWKWRKASLISTSTVS